MITTLANRFNGIPAMFDLEDLFEPLYRQSQTSVLSSFKVDAYEKDGKFIVEAALPGVKAEEVSVQIDNGVLEIKVERESRKRDEKANYSITELNYGGYYRSFTLPRGIDKDNTSAELKNGILSLTFNKTPKNKIEIKT